MSEASDATFSVLFWVAMNVVQKQKNMDEDDGICYELLSGGILGDYSTYDEVHSCQKSCENFAHNYKISRYVTLNSSTSFVMCTRSFLVFSKMTWSE